MNHGNFQHLSLLFFIFKSSCIVEPLLQVGLFFLIRILRIGGLVDIVFPLCSAITVTMLGLCVKSVVETCIVKKS